MPSNVEGRAADAQIVVTARNSGTLFRQLRVTNVRIMGVEKDPWRKRAAGTTVLKLRTQLATCLSPQRGSFASAFVFGASYAGPASYESLLQWIHEP